MIKRFQSKILSKTTNTGSQPGFSELCASLDLIHEPLLLLDLEQELILHANSAYLQRSSYSLMELANQPYEDFLQGLQLPETARIAECEITFQRREQTAWTAAGRVKLLDDSRKWVLVEIPTHTISIEEARAREKEQASSLQQLLDCLETEGMEGFSRDGLPLLRDLLKTDFLALYLAKLDQPVLVRFASFDPDGILPETLPSTDLIRTEGVSIWKPGVRVMTEIQRDARKANAAFLATIPLGCGPARIGILAAGSRQTEPDENLLPLLDLIGTMLGATFQQAALADNNLRERTELEGSLLAQKKINEHMWEGLLVLDSNFHIQEINAAAEWMLGYAQWEVKGQPVDNVLIGTDRLIPALDDARNMVPTLKLSAISLHRRNGQAFPAQMQIIPVAEKDELRTILVFLQDTSESEQIKERAQHLEQRAAIGEWTAVIAHDIRSPINSISTGVQLLAMRLKESDPNFGVVNRIQDDCTKLSQMMESLLAVARPAEPRIENLDIGVFLQRMVDRWRPRFARVKVEPFIHIEENVPNVKGDPRALDRVFTNLISNAVEVMESTGGNLSIRVAAHNRISDHPEVEISVSDSGPGIPDEIKDKIFDPYITTSRKGTGLGLAITKNIVTAHHGNIQVESYPGGSVFKVYLPASNGE